MSAQYTVLITGANRGLGLGLLQLYLARPSTTVVAGVRDPTSPSSQALLSLSKPSSSSVVLVKIDSLNPQDPAAAVALLQSKHSITHLDLVIANAGIATSLSAVRDVEISAIQEHLDVNVYGVIHLFQATIGLLEKAAAPKWVSMSSVGGSLEEQFNMHNLQYGLSKAALNFVTRKIALEHEDLVTLAIHPGWVATDMGNYGAKIMGMEKAPTETAESVADMQKTIDGATQETIGGKFVWADGTVHPW